MSMIGSLIDELRELATRYDELQVGAVKAVTMPSDMGSILRDAADTIQQLRDDLQRANDAVRDAEHDESRAWDRVRKAEAEADRLRELAKEACELARVFCDCGGTFNDLDDLLCRASELGVDG